MEAIRSGKFVYDVSGIEEEYTGCCRKVLKRSGKKTDKKVLTNSYFYVFRITIDNKGVSGFATCLHQSANNTVLRIT